MTSSATVPAAVQAALNVTMRHFVTGVTVLTCGGPAEAEGVTVSTLTTIPGDPPMVCVALRRGSRGLGSLLAAQAFVANGLAADHEWLAQHFARRSRPTGLAQLPLRAWAEPSPHGAPRLRGAVSWLECRIERTVAAGDHELVMARVLTGAATARTPLVNFAGVLHAGPSSAPHAANPANPMHTERKQ
ncbi:MULTISPECIES: flavin reductase family protein [unclassified Streptomyces]|uniref:flavin reductase family protein n=1 Tax=unclassified Streptomyces TaxID=2593676 RepID=UPI00093FE17B|nr:MULTISPECIES: flavin reductase family protein [unclassified Streptomyces]MBT2381564.1 flavin reductase [Streptomyces sp. ISL-111]MBT2429037.1 flavin reductase [Streptomyces sp. ISL-112]MBT2464065.1 flavin reductase [Streptomyces sp. ISL-63]